MPNASIPTASTEYLNRIRFPAPAAMDSLAPSLQTLQALHEAHLLAVPFENLSIHYGQPIILQEDALFDKIVRRQRGGLLLRTQRPLRVVAAPIGLRGNTAFR
ncbi:MAG TPA: arylamine N-acetyltransferase [Ktedonobacteraceae bacterium]|nr:arylamine N-acetyltransferase [Ktedonobacteraceae bacterium]